MTAAKRNALLRACVEENKYQTYKHPAPVKIWMPEPEHESSDPYGPDLPLLPAKPEPKRRSRAVRVPMPSMPALVLVPIGAGLLAGLLALAWWGL